MSRVFLAEEISLGREVVVKVLSPDLAASVNAERFRREIQLAARLQHPHIVPLLAAGISEGLPYYTMPYVEGESLKVRIARTGALPVHDAEKILAEVLSALEYAHQHGIVHRDIKPENILLTGHHAVVADFGVAKAISAATDPGARITSEGIAIGTPAYMAPEQATGDPALDHRADLYSVGAVAYEMLTGHPVFSARSPQALIAAHAAEIPEPLTKRRGSISPALAGTVMRALEKNPADRPQSASEMLAAVEAEMTPSRPPPRNNRKRATSISKWSARRGGVMAMVLGAVVLLLTSSSWYWYREHSGRPDRASADSIPSLAVLPFENLGKPEDAYFADGMTDEISNRLGALHGLRLAGRLSARRYANSNEPVQQIGRELGVGYILTGTIRWDRSPRGRSMVRVSPELLRVSDGTHLWSEPSEDELTGVFNIQSQVAERVARELQVRFKAADENRLRVAPTTNLAAYDDYLQGRKLFDAGRIARAVPFFARATVADPKFAVAFAYLGRARADEYWTGDDLTAGNLAAARKDIDSSIALNPSLPEAHAALGDFYYHGLLDYDKALSEFSLVERLAPNNSDAIAFKGYIERRQGRWAESMRDLRRATMLDPRDPGILGGLASGLLNIREYEASDTVSRRMLELDSTWAFAYGYLANSILFRNANLDSALRVLRVGLRKTEPGQQLFLLDFIPVIVGRRDIVLLNHIRTMPTPSDPRGKSAYYANIALLAHLEGDTARMRVLTDSIMANAVMYLRDPQMADNYADIGLAYALRGDREKATQSFKRALSSDWVARDAMRNAGVLIAFGYAAALVGDNDDAIQAFQHALEVPSLTSRVFLRWDPNLRQLRRDPRFQTLIGVK